MTTPVKQEDGSATPVNKKNGHAEDDEEDRKRRKGPAPGKKPSAEVLQRRKEGRLKAAATIAQNLKKTGIGRFEEENKFTLTSIRAVPLINQKNYFTDYLKKDEQVAFIRNWRREKLLQQKLKNLKKSDSSADKKDDGEIKNFDDFDLNDIEIEMKQKNANVEEEEEEEEDENENEDGEISEEKMKQGYDTIVLHPGSANIRIGRATDSYPKTIPTVIAVPNYRNTPFNTDIAPERTELEGEVIFNEEFDQIKAVVTKDFKSRMRYYKRRMLPNSRETASNYNRKQEPELIPDHNDPLKKDWVDVRSIPTDKKFFVGEEALKLPISAKFNSWKLRYPIKNGKFNETSEDYLSPQEILGDLEHIITDSLEQFFEIEKKQLSNFKCLLVIPDFYDKMYVETWANLLFKIVGFGRIGIIQEAVAATFGAGASCACVIDVGSQTTSISCVDEGMIINDSRVKLNYGGDHITESFIKLLLQQQFPYKDINLNSKVDDFELAQTLKHNFVTFQDADIAVQLYNFYKRKPFETTQKYEFKVFDEVMLAPLGMFYPDLFQIDDEAKMGRLFRLSTDQYSSKPNNPYSKAQENLINNQVYTDLLEEDLLRKMVDEKLILKSANPYSKPKPTKTNDVDHSEVLLKTPLDKAIIESITNAGISTDFDKVRKLYDNLLIVGGGFAKISGYDLILNDRINIWRPKFLSTSNIDEILGYVTGERAKLDEVKRQVLLKYKEKKRERMIEENNDKTGLDKLIIPGNIEDIELDEEEIAEIDEAHKLELDLDYVDSIGDKGSNLTVNVLPPPREFDPEMLTWKGGSVYGRLKVVNEMWITYNDWDILESRCLYYKSLFNY